jgi:propionyl-CoA synthetase
MGLFDEVYARSLKDPEGFWGEAAGQVSWHRKWDMVLDDRSAPFYRWFTGALVNTCHNALDRHVEGGRAEQAALIYDSPVTDTVKSYTYRELRDLTALCAGVLADLGVGKGDRVIIYMPMVPEAVVAMLACARLGAVHSVVFGGFAANELAVRINDAEPKVIISASCGIEIKKVIEYKPLLDEAIRMARHKPERCLILQRPMAKAAMVPGMDIDWNEAMAKAKPHD